MERTPRRRMDPQYRAVKTTNEQEDSFGMLLLSGDPSVPDRLPLPIPHPHRTPGTLACRRKSHLRLARSGDRAPPGLLSSRRSSVHSTYAASPPQNRPLSVLLCCCAVSPEIRGTNPYEPPLPAYPQCSPQPVAETKCCPSVCACDRGCVG